jgi:hypothetical protein
MVEYDPLKISGTTPRSRDEITWDAWDFWLCKAQWLSDSFHPVTCGLYYGSWEKKWVTSLTHGPLSRHLVQQTYGYESKPWMVP